jgi:pre-mRNA-processing factor SLU7
MSRAPPKPSPNKVSSSGEQNQYIPNFISRKPFYVDSTLSDADYLEHQRLQSQPQDTLANSRWYDRGRKLGPAATKFRKGACENCGAMTHKTKDCLSRPRKQGAKWSGKDIQADEVVEDVKLGWDAKRDRWNGYDAREYSAVVKEYEELEALKKVTAGSNGQKQIENGEDAEDNDPEIESAKYAEETDMGRNQPTSTRNLRIREDTAKYLLNLDLDSAKYDPKTRSMADVGASTTNTDKDSDNAASALLADENFMRSSGDAAEFEKAQRYAWETQERGIPGDQKLHLQANPTEGEILRKKQTKEAASKKEASRKALLEKYGGAEHLQPAPFRAAENERYVEYDERGGVKGEVRKIAASKYKEDVLVNNHTSVWGSWWSNFQWGYSCCHSTVKNSYCTGEEGRRAFEDAQRIQGGDLLIEHQNDDKQTAREEEPQRPAQDEKHNLDNQPTDSSDSKTKPTAKKRTLQEMREGITEEELEDFKRNRATAEDPMAKFLGKDELVH